MKTAQDWLADLKTGTKQAYPNITRSDMVAGLTKRLSSPVSINQANTSLCGAACLMYSLAKLKDAVYAQYVVDLYHTGKANLGRLSVEPGSDCRNYKPDPAKGIHPVEWVALASLRDSENDVFDYDEPSDEVGGITMPGDLMDWFKDSGFKNDNNVTNLVFTKDEDCLKAAGKRHLLTQSVCLFINANLLSNPTQGSMFPDHWVVLTSPVTINKGQVSLEVFSWGGLEQVKMPVDRFCKNFYGYISSSAS